MTFSPWTSPEADWVRAGSESFTRALASLTDEDLRRDSGLPGWTRAHVAAHVSANAQAIARLLHWARTGEVTPMYTSVEDRDREIETGSQLAAADLRSWCDRVDRDLLADFSTLPDNAWNSTVVTAQGREVSATETLWMRSRELCIHAVDLDAGVSFADLPTGFLLQLVSEAVGRHSASPQAMSIEIESSEGHNWHMDGSGGSTYVEGTLPAIAQWLTGRGSQGVRTVGGSALPGLGKWL